MIKSGINIHTNIILKKQELKTTEFLTPLGPMIAIADSSALYFLDFFDRRNIERQIRQVKLNTNLNIINGSCEPIISIQKELKNYFDGTLQKFTTQINFIGTAFQQSVWQALTKIPSGQTCSYAELAANIEKPTAFRAVANANGCNRLAIIVPCHRVINSNGNLGGYGGGIERKQWLLQHEVKIMLPVILN